MALVATEHLEEMTIRFSEDGNTKGWSIRTRIDTLDDETGTITSSLNDPINIEQAEAKGHSFSGLMSAAQIKSEKDKDAAIASLDVEKTVRQTKESECVAQEAVITQLQEALTLATQHDSAESTAEIVTPISTALMVVQYFKDLPPADTRKDITYTVLYRTANYLTLGITDRHSAGAYTSNGTEWLYIEPEQLQEA